MRVIFTLFLVTTITAVATAQLQQPESYLRKPHLGDRGTNTDVESNLRLAPSTQAPPVLPMSPPVIYTLDGDFDEGSLVNVNYDSVADQLQLNNLARAFNFIWVACSNRSTVVKVDTINGTILGEYRSAPSFLKGDPSHTTVDQLGNVWFTNRNDVGRGGNGTIVHIGLKENNQCKDRNKNGKIDTSTGLGDIKPWPVSSDTEAANDEASIALDECIVHYTEVNSKGTRHMSIDKDNNVWVSGYKLRTFDLIDGETGKIIKTYPSVGYGGYGGLMDRKGFLWSSGPLLRWDTRKPLTGPNGDPDRGPSIGPLLPNTSWAGQGQAFGGLDSLRSYGLCIDSKGNVWSTKWRSIIDKFGPDGRYLGNFSHGGNRAEGCVVDGKDDVWVAQSRGAKTVGHLKKDGKLLGTVQVGNGPTGVAVDALGKVWSTNLNDNTLSRIDPAANGGIGAVDLTVDLGTGCAPYNYGDMTGSMNIAPPDIGSWTVVQFSGYNPTNWGRINWNAEVPVGSKLTVQVSSDGNLWRTVTNSGEKLSETGPKLYMRVNFKRAANGNTPVLFDLSLSNDKPPNKPPDCSGAVASPGTISTVDNTFRSVLINGVTDPDGDTLTITVTGIRQDERVFGGIYNIYGSRCPDGKITTTGAQVRAERPLVSNGRVYHIDFTADDRKGGKCAGKVKVCVSSRTGRCVDNGATWNSLQLC